MSAGINEIENRGVEEDGKRGGLTAQPQHFSRVSDFRLGGAHVAVFAMCASGGYSSQVAHIAKKRDVCATPAARLEQRHKTRGETAKIKIRKTNLECPLESMR